MRVITVGTRWDSKGFIDFIVCSMTKYEYTTNSLTDALKYAGRIAELDQCPVKILEDCVEKLKEL